MVVCDQCGGKLRRVHRTLFEKFRYSAIYECRECATPARVSRPYTYNWGPDSRCPRCGTLRVVRHKERDRIDGMYHGFFNFLKKLAGGKLTHCQFCRLQFYDRRPLASEARRAQ